LESKAIPYFRSLVREAKPFPDVFADKFGEEERPRAEKDPKVRKILLEIEAAIISDSIT
jgi:hypothetical protein